MPIDTSLCACGSGLRSLRCCAFNLDWISPRGSYQPLEAMLVAAREAAQAGRPDEAMQTCRSLLELAPGWVDALLLLARLLRPQAARVAEILLARAVAIQPNHLGATIDLGQLQLMRGALMEAEFHARNAVRIEPESPGAHHLLAMTLTRGNRAHSGEYHYRRVLALTDGKDPAVQANLAWNLKEQGRIDEARALYEASLATAPENVMALLGAARLEEVDRKLAAAQVLLDRVARLAPDHPELALLRAVCAARTGQKEEALRLLDALGGLAAGKDGQRELSAVELSEKGRILDQLGRYDEAWAAFDAGKRRLRESGGPTYQDQHAAGLFGRLSSFFVAKRLATLPHAKPASGPQPIFIVGFPRSGTTLMEQSLTAHPRIAAGDELPFIWEIANALPRLLDSRLGYPEALAELWMGDKRSALEPLRDLYLLRAAEQGFLNQDSFWFTDKMPLNETHLGLIGLLFPDAPIIHLIRHPLDVVVSVYSNHLTHGFNCAAELATIATHLSRTAELVQHYRQEMTLRYLPFRYEDFVADHERSLRLIFEFIGEPFDQRCLDVHKNARYARTASYAQVTEPIYDRSVYRYRHYLSGLQPVIPILEPVITRLGYRLTDDEKAAAGKAQT